MATSATINLTANTDEASTKDDTGLSSKPEVTSRSGQVSVESLSVADVATMLTAIKNQTQFTLIWDETDPASDQNHEAEGADFSRKAKAIINDATFSFEDRANATKSLQFTLITEPETTSTVDVMTNTGSAYTKGQFVRLFLSSDNTATPDAVLAAAKNLQLHVSLSLEDSTTKDTTGNWQVQEVTGLSYDITTNALVRSGDVITSSVAGKGFNDLQQIHKNSVPVKFQIANVSGANQRTKGTVLMSGSVLITSLALKSPNRQSATYDATLQGWGDYTVGA